MRWVTIEWMVGFIAMDKTRKNEKKTEKADNFDKYKRKIDTI